MIASYAYMCVDINRKNYAQIYYIRAVYMTQK